MSDIFISYASEDVAYAHLLAEKLAALGWAVWWDRTLRPGSAFTEEITTAIASAKCVIVLWSATSTKKTWVQNEARRGFRRNVLFPVHIVRTPDVPIDFEHLNGVDLADWNGSENFPEFVRLVQALKYTIGLPTPPLPLETPTVSDAFPNSEAAKNTVTVLLIRGEDPENKPIFAYVAVRADKLPAFLAAQRSGTFYPEDFGVILESGRGEPSPDVRRKMEQEYGFNHQSMTDIPDVEAAARIVKNLKN